MADRAAELKQENKKRNQGKALATNTTVTDPDTGEAVTFKAGDKDLPEWALELINNESAFEDESADEVLDYEAMTVPELLDLADQRHVELSSTKKSDVVAALQENDRASVS